ncbi:MAG: hypothetical protein K0R64_1484 [Novosphingobium lindaniclasticum]|jgi:hypothetical protein|uniref:hypothetical protein n=1 Tax=Novosphingobium lindaniclasticum TaxID=1329895 RepID=UPI00240A427C|nr:hypothetical protein [Novosphingobium lindaniclasticum]MDF2638500.1 hypothetical protein [Novosphingobium lindaniclasticum]
MDIATYAPWLEIVKTAAPVATACIAYRALRNWQRQDRAKRQAEFLDELIDATHEHIVDMQRPIELLRMAKIGIASHANSWETRGAEDQTTAGALTYIEKHGEQDAKRLNEALAATQPSVVKLRSLSSKGQIFKFPEYTKCHNAVAKLVWHFGRIQAFTTMIASPTWNWDHPDVSSLLQKVLIIDPDEIQNDLGENDAAIIKFAQNSYTRIYG